MYKRGDRIALKDEAPSISTKPTVSLGKSRPVESQQTKGCKGCKRYERPATCNTTKPGLMKEGIGFGRCAMQ